MYSGSTLTLASGRVLGAHQKIDRVARKHLDEIMPASDFPTANAILHFEGKNGPDGIKRKSPAKDEPWHYFQPFDDSDTGLLEMIREHYDLLVGALIQSDDVKAAFEAAWLAHAIVDGLTPAHHFPYEEKLTELRGGEGIESRTTIKKKLLLPGDTRRMAFKNNWLMWGTKGIFTTHAAFELGVATIIAPLKLGSARPSTDDIEEYESLKLEDWYRRKAKEIAALDLYDKFYKFGWTPRMAHRIRRQLAPAIIKVVTLTWYGAALEARSPAGMAKRKAR